MTALAKAPAIVGIAGWKNSGKTTLTCRLVEAFTARGLKVATLKHAHHAFEIDDGATDSARHRRAGAGQVAIVSGTRWAIVTELAGQAEPSIEEIVAKFAPCDLVIIEGYKWAAIPKIEVRRQVSLKQNAIVDSDPNVIAIAADHVVSDATVPVFDLDDIAAIAAFLQRQLGLRSPGAQTGGGG